MPRRFLRPSLLLAALISACSDDTSAVVDESSSSSTEDSSSLSDTTPPSTSADSSSSTGATLDSSSGETTPADSSESSGTPESSSSEGESSSSGTPESSSSGASSSSDAESSSSQGESSSSEGESSSTGPVSTCGDELAEGAEACDGSDLLGASCLSLDFDAGELGCAPDCSAFDTSACIDFSCGDGGIQGRESCDGDNLGGQTCFTQGFDGGALACGDDCSFDTSACIIFACGNDILEGDELCDSAQIGAADCISEGFDDGVLGCLDDCSDYDTSACITFACGNGILEGDEVCDGADLGAFDCTTEGFDGGALGCADDCGAVIIDACTDCGDFAIEGAETCEGYDLGGADCVDAGFAGGALFCDASCGFATASCFSGVTETEPNDDGATAVATSDFSTANADGPFDDDVLITAAIGVAGDDDVFAVTNDSGGPAVLTLQTFGPAGPGTCTMATDTVVDIRDAGGVSLATSDDAGISPCSLISSFSMTPDQTVYVTVVEYGDNGPIAAGYQLQINLVPVGCGNGVLEAGELCDDRNTGTGDGCDAACQIEGLVEEVENNGTTAAADLTGVTIDDAVSHTRIRGAISAVGDADFFRIDVAAAGVLRLETFSTLGRCNGGITTTMRLVTDLGAPLLTDTTGGISSCSAIVYPVVAGTYYVSIREAGDNATIGQYILEAAFATDRGVELEANDVTAQANLLAQGTESFVFGDHMLATDSDFYAIYVPWGASLRLETVEGALGVETCESNGIDATITLYNAAGVQLDMDDDSGRGNCARVDGTGDAPASPPAHTLPGGLYYVRVAAAGAAPATQFVYRLAVTIRSP